MTQASSQHNHQRADRGDPIEIFRAGRHTTGAGTEISFSVADLQATAAAYDPALSEAPLCVGHPKDNKPAYGWGQSLQVQGDRLMLVPHQVDAEFAELVSTGRFKKRSSAFYRPDDPKNPKPGVYYLRHVAYLGAQAPAVKGLRDHQFADAGDSALEFVEHGRWAWASMAALFRGMREWLIADRGIETADRVVPNYYLSDIEAAAKAPVEEAVAAPAALSYSEGEGANVPDPDLAAREAAAAAQAAANTARAAELDAREAQLRAGEGAAQRQGLVQFCEGLQRAGRLLPKDKPAVVEVLAALPTADIEFGEGDDKVKKSPRELLQGFLQALPLQVDFNERAGGKAGDELDTEDPHAISKAALVFQEAEGKAGRQVSIEAAVQHVVDQHKQKERA